jgi:hypothetical protein
LSREKIRYLEEGREETADIHAKYPREPPEIAPPQFTKDQVRTIMPHMLDWKLRPPSARRVKFIMRVIPARLDESSRL